MEGDMYFAEIKAAEACNLATFRGFDLKGAKDKLASMLSRIGSNDMFSEYTKHDITHVNGMLESLDFIIPEDVKCILTPSDWMMIVLSCYFHDLGMVISTQEYNNRYSEKAFQNYKNGKVFDKYESLDKEIQERYIYQDYVRDNHGKRIETLLNNVAAKKNIDNPVATILRDMLCNINSQFLKDLGRVCRSHSEKLDWLKDAEVSKPYEQSDKSNVNILYAAAILRTADLLHVNSERTPNIDYLLISPQDSYSNREWVKQQSITQIRIAPVTNEDGIVDKTKQSHTFDVYGCFTDEDAYSHFMDYLKMAERELLLTYQICKASSEKNGNEYIFPWNTISRDNIKTEGFNAEKLRFELEQENILTLLIGHTLYNQANVALRELSQNAIDACRLMDYNSKSGSNNYKPKVVVEWNSSTRVLKVSDNGTGMNEDIIKKYLLKVGASRYQSHEFKEEFKSFHSISRFGIGLLTCFMISDDFDVITLWHEEDKAHRLKIKNVQGEYMLRNDVETDEILEGLHGTTFILRVHKNVDFSEIVEELRRWIIVPGCDFEVKVDGILHHIGYDTPQEALIKYLEKNQIIVDDIQYKLVNKRSSDLNVSAYFLLRKHNIYSGNWILYTPTNDILNDMDAPIGICIEGIMVTQNTPGFSHRNYVALVNCSGEKSPKTNVARDGLEQSVEHKKLLRFIYQSYLEVINEHENQLVSDFSLAWALKEAQYQIDRLATNGQYNDKELFDECLCSYNCNLVDTGSKYDNVSIDALGDEIWTIESKAYSAAENLLQEIRGSQQTALALFQQVDPNFDKSERKIFSGVANQKYINEIFLSKYEVDKICVFKDARRIEFRWKRNQNRWIQVCNDYVRHYSHTDKKVYVINDLQSIEYESDDHDALVSKYGLFCVSSHPLFIFMKKLHDCNDSNKQICIEFIASYLLYVSREKRQFNVKAFEQYFNGSNNYWGTQLWEWMDKDKLFQCFEQPMKLLNFNVFYNI